MARTRTLAELEEDVRWQGNAEGVTARHTSARVRRAINQSIQEFRELVSDAGHPYFLRLSTDSLDVGPSGDHAFGTIDISALSPAFLRAYGLDIKVCGVWTPVPPINFEQRNDWQYGTSSNGQPQGFFLFNETEVGFAPAADQAYEYKLYYLPTWTDLEDDDDTFDGLSGCEEWVVFNAAAKLKLRDNFGEEYAAFAAERQRLLEGILARSRSRQHAGATGRNDVRGRDGGARGLSRALVQVAAGGGLSRVNAADRSNIYNLPYEDARHHGTLVSGSAAAAVANAATINAALVIAGAAAVALTGPCEVLLPAGTFHISTTLTVPSNVTLRGAGMGKTVLYMPAAYFTNTTAAAYNSTSTGVSCLGLLVAPYTQAENISLVDFTIESEVSDGRYLYPILARNVAGLHVARVEAFGIPAGVLVCLDSITRGVIEDCYLHDCTSAVVTSLQTTGIETDNNRVNSVNCRALRIHSNTIENLTMSGAALPTPNMQTDGINLGAGSQHGIQVYDNYIRNVGEGIDCFSSECTIHSNELLDCYNVGVKLIHGACRNHVFGNTILRPGLAGIYLADSNAGATEDNYIHDNEIHDVNPNNVWPVASYATAAIRLDVGVATYQPNRNTISRNKVTGGATYMRYIVRQDNGTDNRFYDNEGEVWATAYSSVSAGTATITNAKKTLVRARLDADQNFSSGGGQTVVNFKTEDIDKQDEYTPATPIYTANSHRRLRVRAQVRLPTATAGEQLKLRLRKNGNEFAKSMPIVGATGEFDFVASDVVEVVPGDTIDVTFDHTSGSTRTITATTLQSYLTIEEVAS